MRYCAQPGCSQIVPHGRCPTHARAIDQGTRGTAQQRGYTSKWAAYSRRFRQQHPICGEHWNGVVSGSDGSRCAQQGLTVRAECVDHIVPVSQGGSMWQESNHQALCNACNTAKLDRMHHAH